jgi:hypothetical protein
MSRIDKIKCLSKKVDEFFKEEIGKFSINESLGTIQGIASVGPTASKPDLAIIGEIARQCISLSLPLGWRYLKQVDDACGTSTTYIFRQEESSAEDTGVKYTADVRVLYKKENDVDTITVYLVRADQYRAEEMLNETKFIIEGDEMQQVFALITNLMTNEKHYNLNGDLDLPTCCKKDEDPCDDDDDDDDDDCCGGSGRGRTANFITRFSEMANPETPEL